MPTSSRASLYACPSLSPSSSTSPQPSPSPVQAIPLWPRSTISPAPSTVDLDIASEPPLSLIADKHFSSSAGYPTLLRIPLEANNVADANVRRHPREPLIPRSASLSLLDDRRPPRRRRAPMPDPSVTIQWIAFPHIIDGILGSADLATLCAFRCTSRHFRHKIEAELCTIVITETALGALHPRTMDDEDESELYMLSLRSFLGQPLGSFTTAMEPHRRGWRYKLRSPGYSLRNVGYLGYRDLEALSPLVHSTFPLVLRVVGDCVRQHRLLLGIFDALRRRPHVTLHFEPDAQGTASQLAWPSPWPVVLLHNSRINWWSGAYLYDAPRVVYVFDGSEGDLVVGPRIHGGQRLHEVVFDFTDWSPIPMQEQGHSDQSTYPSRTTQLAARAASLSAPGRAVVFRGLERVDPTWLDPEAGTTTPKELLRRKTLDLSPVPPFVSPNTTDDVLRFGLPPPPPPEPKQVHKTFKTRIRTLSLPSGFTGVVGTFSPLSSSSSLSTSPAGGSSSTLKLGHASVPSSTCGTCGIMPPCLMRVLSHHHRVGRADE